MVKLPGSPGVVHRNGQHDNVLTSTPVETRQVYPGRNNPQQDAHWRGQLAPGTRDDFLHGYCPTWYQGILQPYARCPTAHEYQIGGANEGRPSGPIGISIA